MKYVSDKYKGDPHGMIGLPVGASFDDMIALKGDKEIGDVQAEIERVTQQLANRVKELEERYAEPLPDIESTVQALSDKVAGHLKAVGLTV